MTFRGLFTEVVLPAVAIVVCTFCIVLLLGFAVSAIPGQQYTVKHGESIHRNAKVNFYGDGVICVIDSDGRRFYYRDGWEVAQEVSK